MPVPLASPPLVSPYFVSMGSGPLLNQSPIMDRRGSLMSALSCQYSGQASLLEGTLLLFCVRVCSAIAVKDESPACRLLHSWSRPGKKTAGALASVSSFTSLYSSCHKCFLGSAGMGSAPSAPLPGPGAPGNGIVSINSGPLPINLGEGHASAPLPMYGGLMSEGHGRGRKMRARGGLYNPQVLVSPVRSI